MTDEFDASLEKVLTARPGLTKDRLAAAMGLTNEDEFRRKLDEACDKDIAHKIGDKVYPGVRKAY